MSSILSDLERYPWMKEGISYAEWFRRDLERRYGPSPPEVIELRRRERVAAALEKRDRQKSRQKPVSHHDLERPGTWLPDAYLPLDLIPGDSWEFVAETEPEVALPDEVVLPWYRHRQAWVARRPSPVTPPPVGRPPTSGLRIPPATLRA